MAIKILMPALSPTMTEGNLAKWHVKEGDTVHPGEIIAEIETDKATMEVESADEGVLGKIFVHDGTEAVAVNQVIGVLLEPGESTAEIVALEDSGFPLVKPVTPVKTNSSKTEPSATPVARRLAEQSGVDLKGLSGSGAHGKITKADVESDLTEQLSALADMSVRGSAKAETDRETRLFASPLARKMAAQAEIDLGTVTGSGPEGRIVKRDIDSLIVAGNERTVLATSGSLETGLSEVEKLSTMRKVIAQRMHESKTKVPHFYLTMDYELDELLKIRLALNESQDEVRISVNDFVIRACALALMEVPDANVAYENDEEIRRFHSADIAVAVAIPGGLVTPIIREAEGKGLKQVSTNMKDLAERAREGKLTQGEYQGGSFSVSNLGMFGVKQFDAIINPPHACIIAVGAAEPRPVVKEGEIVTATVMTCTLSVDHRVVDGTIAAALLAAIKQNIENPALMLL